MDKQNSVWYLPSKNTWKDSNMMAMKDIGTLVFEDKTLIFKGKKDDVQINSILSISYGKQGRDFVNNWVQIEYQTENDEIKTAFFADGGMIGWSGIFGGTKKLMNKIESKYL